MLLFITLTAVGVKISLPSSSEKDNNINVEAFRYVLNQIIFSDDDRNFQEPLVVNFPMFFSPSDF